MNREMVISSNGHETSVALLEDDLVSEVFIERERQRGVVSNVYKGRVSKVLPGMQCAFVDIGLERDAFLYVSDVIASSEELKRLESDDDDEEDSAAGAAGADSGGSGRRDRGRGRDRGPQQKIEDLLRAGQEVQVQVVKEPLGTKGARITCHVTMPGRFLVFMPTLDHIGISRKIDSREERGRLRGIVKEFRAETGFGGGVIIRTAAAKRPREEIIGDLNYFHRIWLEMGRRSKSTRAPAVVYQEQSLVAKLLRDLLTEQFTAIRIDNAEEHARVVELLRPLPPHTRLAAVSDAGQVPARTGLPTLDFGGLNDRVLARRSTPIPAQLDHAFAWAPDVVVIASARADRVQRRQPRVQALADDPRFAGFEQVAAFSNDVWPDHHTLVYARGEALRALR